MDSVVLKDLLLAKEAIHSAQQEYDRLLAMATEGLEVELGSSKTFQNDEYKAVYKRGINRRADFQAMRDAGIDESNIPSKMKETLDEAYLEYLKNNDPDTYLKVIKHVTSKPAKESLTIKVK